MSKYDEYLSAKKIREKAEEWEKLHEQRGYYSGRYEQRGYYSDPFSMRIGLYKLQLIKASQRSSEDKNSWTADEKLAKTILRLIKEDPTIIERAIDELKEKENQALAEYNRQTIIDTKEEEMGK